MASGKTESSKIAAYGFDKMWNRFRIAYDLQEWPSNCFERYRKEKESCERQGDVMSQLRTYLDCRGYQKYRDLHRWRIQAYSILLCYYYQNRQVV